MSELCERTSKRTSEWPNTYVPILGCSAPLPCTGITDENRNRLRRRYPTFPLIMPMVIYVEFLGITLSLSEAFPFSSAHIEVSSLPHFASLGVTVLLYYFLSH